MNWQTYKFRCHSLGKIMASPAKNELPVGAITECNLIHREHTWQRRREFKSKYTTKGNKREEDAVTMIALRERCMLRKNKERISNEYLTGEPDLYEGESILTATRGWDAKCSFTWETFPYPGSKLDSDYEYQNMGYMDLTGAKSWSTVHCLINTTLPLLQKEFKFARYAVEDEYGDDREVMEAEYVKACAKLERKHIYDMASFMKEYPDYTPYTTDWNYDIPASQRIISFPVEWDSQTIERIYARIRLCRNYLSSIPVHI